MYFNASSGCAGGTPAFPAQTLQVRALYRGRFFRKPLRAISPFRHQDAQTPPSPRVGEGGWGDEGQTPTEMPAHPSQELYP
jgi:hypothetical protein